MSSAFSCKEQTFANADDAEACVKSKVIATDDCLPVLVSTAFDPIPTSDCTVNIVVTAAATGCEDPGRDTAFDETTKRIDGLKVDGIPPVVSCDLTATGLKGKTNSFVDAGLTYSAVDNCNAPVSVILEAFSTEELESGNNQVVFSSAVNGAGVKLFVDDDFCNNGSNKCLMDNVKKSRTYVVRITGTDESGNSASALCDHSVTVGSEEVTGPLFLLSSIEA